jgi:uncharacterized membrane protein YccC
LGRIHSATPALLFGLRLWVAVCFALWVAFALELDNAFWAGTTAAIVCQPSLGASLRKASFRLIGTVVGAVVIVILTACLSQDREGFLLGLALWGAACGFVATIARNFTSYAAALAGYTAVIIANDALGATGGVNDEVFMLAITRGSEIAIGIVCAAIVLAGTDLGGARRRLTRQIADLGAEIAGRFGSGFSMVGAAQAETRMVRRGLVGRVVALDSAIDEVIGESLDLRYRVRKLRTAIGGFFAALSGWRTVANCLEQLPRDRGRREAEILSRALPQDLRSVPTQEIAAGWAAGWAAHPLRCCRNYRAAARALLALPADTPSLRLLADASAETLLGLARALEGLAVLIDPGRSIARNATVRLHIPDLLPAFINALRVFLTIGAAALFWIVTAWPNGALAMTFAAIGVILLSPREDQAYAAAQGFIAGTLLTAAIAAVVSFAILPSVTTFVGFSLVLGLVLVPVGTLLALDQKIMLYVVINFVPLVAPANQMTYDTFAFYNSTLAIIAGIGVAALAFLLVPPLPPALRVRRLLALALRDLRRLAAGLVPPVVADWESRIYSRLSALPAEVEPLQFARTVAALSVGTELVRLRRIARRLNLGPDFRMALDAIAHGRSALAVEQLSRLDSKIAGRTGAGQEKSVRLRARGSIQAMTGALTQHRTYFDSAGL